MQKLVFQGGGLGGGGGGGGGGEEVNKVLYGLCENGEYSWTFNTETFSRQEFLSRRLCKLYIRM